MRDNFRNAAGSWAGLGRALDSVRDEIAPYPTGNGHPAFFAWVNSPPAPAGIVADLPTAGLPTC
ncbi:hypothetical protein ACGFY7_26435 [Streptomyces prunicolor]|uniref:hypothetical protein n=1 Tax=Streptomyces prunicolor TaxID=67348 RepID=UPI00371E2472